MEQDIKSTGMIVGVIVAIGFVVLVGIVLMDSLSNASDVNNAESFTVADPSSDKVCSLAYQPEGTPVVRYYNGTAWSTLTLTTDFTVSGDTVTVKASAMD